MDSYTYMSNRAMTGFKLSNLQYRNEVDIDNRYKVKPIYAVSPNGDVERLYKRYQDGLITRKQYEDAIIERFS